MFLKGWARVKCIILLMPNPSGSSKKIGCVRFFYCVQYFLNVVKYLWPWSNMQIYKVKYNFWPWSKILNVFKYIVHGTEFEHGQNFWTNRSNRHESLSVFKGGGMYLVSPVIVIVIVTVIVFLQCLSCSIGQN